MNEKEFVVGKYIGTFKISANETILRFKLNDESIISIPTNIVPNLKLTSNTTLVIK